MRDIIRRKLDMAARVRDFSLAQPAEGERYQQLVTKLGERIARAQALDAQHRAGRLAVRVSSEGKAALRRGIREEWLRHLARMAQGAAAERPELGTLFQLPKANVSHQAFLTAARTILAEATSRQELFTSWGMAPGFVEAFGQALAQFEAAVNQGHAGRSAHVGARAELEAVTEEVMGLVQQLDAMHRYRFRNDPEKRAAWESARNVAWPMVVGPAMGVRKEEGKSAA